MERLRRVAGLLGTSHCDVPARVQRAERMVKDARVTAHVAPLNAARTAQRAVRATRDYTPAAWRLALLTLARLVSSANEIGEGH